MSARGAVLTPSSLAVPGLAWLDVRSESPASQTRSSFVQLQALVAVILSYQVLFTDSSVFSGETQLGIVLGLLLTCGLVISLPDRWLAVDWFPGVLAFTDTLLVTGLIYVSGNLSSELYLAYFAILLIATMTRTQKQMVGCFVIIFALYGLALYRDILASGLPLEHHLLRMPLLLVMAIFYGRTVGCVRALMQFDSVTGLPNKRKFLALLAESLERARRTNDAVGVLALSVDGFKMVSDTFGHHAGDAITRAAAVRLSQGPAFDLTMARQDTHEFAVLMTGVSSPEDCAGLAQRILKAMEPAFPLGTREIFLTCYIGIAMFPRDADDAHGLMRNADAAMSRARDEGKNVYRFYSADIHAQAFQRLELAQSLRRALDRDELRLVYQPQVDLITGQLTGVEALLRWTHPALGPISPSHCVSLAEETGLIVPIGQWVLRTACAQVRAWQTTWQTKGGPSVRLAVNLSIRQLTETDLVRLIAHALRETGLDPRQLEIELTESLLLQDQPNTVETLDRLKALGVRLAIDDFGTGYSALSYLQRFPIDTIKIDQSFIRNVPVNQEAQAIVRAIIGMARALNLNVIAEGVETKEQAAFLREEGCHECQGYLFGRPLSAEDLSVSFSQWETAVVRSA